MSEAQSSNPLNRRISLVEVAGGGEVPYLKIQFASIEAMRAASDYIRSLEKWSCQCKEPTCRYCSAVETTEEPGPCPHCLEAHAMIDDLQLDIGSGNIADRLGDVLEKYDDTVRAGLEVIPVTVVTCSGCRAGVPLENGAHRRPDNAGWEVCTAEETSGAGS